MVTGSIHYEYGLLELAVHHPHQALEHFERALRISGSTVSERTLQVAERSAGMGMAYLQMGKADKALPLLRRAHEIGSASSVDPWLFSHWKLALATALERTHGDSRRASRLAREANEVLTRLRAEVNRKQDVGYSLAMNRGPDSR